MNEKLIKILLSILLFACLLKMPYGYYQLIRILSTVTFLYLAFLEDKKGIKNNVFIFIGLAVLFQPFVKISLGREIWKLVDVIVAFFLLLNVFLKKSKES
jgi:hypothetical protein